MGIIKNVEFQTLGLELDVFLFLFLFTLKESKG